MVIANASYDILISNVTISGKDNTNVSSAPTSKGVIVVGGTNENNPVVTPNQTASLKENPTVNTYFYKVKATDADFNSFVDDFKIVSGNDDGTFGIVPETGDLFVIKPENVDYESKQSHSIGITVSDGTKISAEETITVNITNEPNTFVVNNFTVNVYRDNSKSGSTNRDSDDISSAASGSDITYELYGGNDKDLFLAENKINWITHKIKPGDSLWELARKYDTRVEIIKKINFLEKDLLSLNETILIPLSQSEDNNFIPFEVHVVSEGDSLWSIASRYKLSAREIARNNSIEINSILTIGQQLNIGNKNIYRTINSKKRTILYSVKQGDSLYRIADLFNIEISDIKFINQLSDNEITPGQVLKIIIKAF